MTKNIEKFPIWVRATVYFLVFIALSFILIGIFFNETYLMKWSYDGNISKETLAEIFKLRALCLLLGSFLICTILVLHKRGRVLEKWINSKKETFKNILLLTITFITLLGMMEIYLWSILKDKTEGAGFGPGSLNFNEKYVSLNNEGMRDFYFKLEKSNATRIVVLGDSFTFGAGVKNVTNIYSKELEYLLRKRGEYEVYTFAVPGYNAWEEYVMFRDKAVKYKPDILIIGFFLNDMENIDESTKKMSGGVNWRLPLIGYWLREVSYTYYFFETKLNKAMETLGLKQKWINSINQVYSSEINRKFTKEIYKNISKLCVEINCTVNLVSFPLITSDLANYSNYSNFFVAHKFAEEVALENNFGYLDLLPAYSKFESQFIVVNEYDSHPNELGHKIAAESIYIGFFTNKTNSKNN